jgi:hypothetical protein
MLCEVEHQNPNLKLFDKPPNFEVFAKIIGFTCVHSSPFSGSAPVAESLSYSPLQLFKGLFLELGGNVE